jgi:Ribbon-helix-helix protein, copG family
MFNTVKLPADLQADLDATARREGVTKSAIIRRALVAEIARSIAAATPTPYELGKDLFGKARSGRRNLSSTRPRDFIANPERAPRNNR